MTKNKQKRPEKKPHLSYEEMVEYFAKNKVNSEISNGVEAHASLLISAMFKYGDKTIRIFCRELSDKVYDNEQLIDNAIDFVVKKQGKIEILLENDLQKALFAKPIIFRIASKIYEAQDKKRAVGSLHVKIQGQDHQKHFCVMDDSAYRLEQDKEKRTAIANFNDPKMVQSLTTSFKSMFENSKEAFAA
jgi:hypothetical protein